MSISPTKNAPPHSPSGSHSAACSRATSSVLTNTETKTCGIFDCFLALFRYIGKSLGRWYQTHQFESAVERGDETEATLRLNKGAQLTSDFVRKLVDNNQFAKVKNIAERFEFNPEKPDRPEAEEAILSVLDGDGFTTPLEDEDRNLILPLDQVPRTFIPCHTVYSWGAGNHVIEPIPGADRITAPVSESSRVRQPNESVIRKLDHQFQNYVQGMVDTQAEKPSRTIFNECAAYFPELNEERKNDLLQKLAKKGMKHEEIQKLDYPEKIFMEGYRKIVNSKISGQQITKLNAYVTASINSETPLEKVLAELFTFFPQFNSARKDYLCELFKTEEITEATLQSLPVHERLIFEGFSRIKRARSVIANFGKHTIPSPTASLQRAEGK